MATDNAMKICEAAAAAGTTVTLDMEDHTTTDLTLETLAALRVDHPATAAVLQAYLHRTEGDCRDLAVAGSRIRLCKGAYREPESVALQDRADIDRSYVRCMKILLAGDGYPMFATHDDRLISIGEALTRRYERSREHLRVPDAVRGHGGRNSVGCVTPASEFASTSPTEPSGTATWCAGWQSVPPTSAWEFVPFLTGSDQDDLTRASRQRSER